MKSKTMMNPLTGRAIKIGGPTYNKLLNSNMRNLITGKGKYGNVPLNRFCGPSGGAEEGSYPVNTEQRCLAAKRYAYHAPNPSGIIKCADKIAKIEGWSCGKKMNNGKRMNNGKKKMHKNKMHHGKKKMHNNKKKMHNNKKKMHNNKKKMHNNKKKMHNGKKN